MAESEATLKAVLEVLLEQQKSQQEQHRLLLTLFEEQKDELMHHRWEMAEIRSQREERVTARLPKPTLQKLSPDDDIKHFLATFERIARQQGWPDNVWTTQLAGLLTGKALAAYAGLNGASAASYEEVKQRDHQISKLTVQNKLLEVTPLEQSSQVWKRLMFGLPAGQPSFLARASINYMPSNSHQPGQIEHESVPFMPTMPTNNLHDQTHPQLLQNSTEPSTIHLETQPSPADHCRVYQAPQSRCLCLL